MSAKDDILKKYGGSVPSSSPTSLASSVPVSTSKQAIIDKYSGTKAPAVASTSTPAPTVAPVISSKQAIIDKYSGKTPTPTPVAPAPVTVAPPVTQPKETISSDTGTGVKSNSLQDALAAVGAPTLFTKNVFTDIIGGAVDNLASRASKMISSFDSSKKENTPLVRTVNTVETAVGVVNTLLSPLSAAFKAAEKIPVAGKAVQAFNYGFDKLSEGAGWVTNTNIDALPISQETKDLVKPAVAEIAGLVAQTVIGGKAAEKGIPIIKEKTKALADTITKDVITQNNLPQHVYIDSAKIKDIFQTGEKISPAEMDLVKTLGLDGAGYKKAINDGVSIEIPASTVTLLVDKPYWSKVKESIGLQPTEKVLSTSGGGGPRQTVRGYLNEGKTQYTAPQAIPGFSPGTEAPIKVTKAIESPVSPKLLETLQAFSQPESLAFGKKIVERIANDTGVQVADLNKGSTDAVKVSEMKSQDGRPAQFSNGKVEIFMPDLLRDISDLAKGKEILAHDGAYSKVYKLTPGESIGDLATRYFKDVVIHELAHAKTVSVQDGTTIARMQQEIFQAQATKDQAKIIAAKTQLDNFRKTLEVKAEDYARKNQEALMTEAFGSGRQTKTQAQIDSSISGADSKTFNRSEKTLLKDRIKNLARGTKEGIRIGTEKATTRMKAIADNLITTKEAKLKREKELALLKQRITDRAKAENAIAEKNVSFEKTLTKVKDSISSNASKRTALIEYAEALLPFRERAKFIRSINKPGSENNFRNILDRMNKAADTVERAKLISEIVKEIKDTKPRLKNKIPNVKLEYNIQKTFNKIRALQATFESNAKALRDAGNKNASAYALAQAEIATKVSDFQTANPDLTLPDELVAEIQLLKMVGLKDMTSAELRSVYQDVTSLKETGRTLKDLERFNRDSEIIRAKDKIFEIITGNKPLKAESVSLRKEVPRTVKGEVKNFFTVNQYGWEEMLDLLSKFDKTSKPYQSFLSNHISKKTDLSFNKQNEGEVTSITKVNESLKEVYKLKSDKDVLIHINEMQKPVDLGNIMHSDGVARNLTISRGEALQMWMWNEDPTLSDTFSEGLKWGEPAKDAAFGILTEADKAMGQKLLDFYQEYYKRVNDVYSKEYGIDLPFNENYSPVTRDVETTMPENVLLANEGKAYASAKNNSLKSRVKSNIELQPIDALQNVTRHIAKMEHYIAWSDTMFDLRRTFGDKQIRQGIRDFHGPEALKIMDNFINDMARDGISREKVIKMVDMMRSNVTKALLGLNLKVGLKQIPGVFNYAIELPVSDFFTGVGSFWKAPLEKSRFLYKNSQALQERFGDGYERDIKYAISKGYDKTLSKTKNLSEIMFVLIRNADKLTVYQGAWASYRKGYGEAIKAGKTESEAKAAGLKLAEDITNRVQESSRLDTLSSIQRGGSLAKLFTMFQSQPSKFLRIMNNAARNYKYGRGSKATNVKRLLFAWFVIPLIYNTVANSLVKDQYKKDAASVILQSFLGPLSYPLIFGQIFQSIFGWTQGETFNYQPSPLFSMFDDIQKAIGKTQKKTVSTGDLSEAVTYLIDFAGKMKGVPTTVLTKPLRESIK